MGILQERAKGVDLGDMWDGYEATSLIGGSAKDLPPELQVLAAPANANYKGLTPTRYKLAEDPEDVRLRFMGYQKSIDSGAAKFKELTKLMEQGVTIPDQIGDRVGTIARNLGIEVGDGPLPTTKARSILKQIAVREATNILQESGKTLSDNDRKRVEELVGEINFASADKELILSRLSLIHI